VFWRNCEGIPSHCYLCDGIPSQFSFAIHTLSWDWQAFQSEYPSQWRFDPKIATKFLHNCYDFYKKMPVKYSLAFESWNLNMKILTDFSIINSITNLVSRSQFFCDRIIPSRGDFRHNCNRPVTIHKLICDQWNFDRQISVINFITISEFSSQLWYFSVTIDTFYCSDMYKSLVAPLSSTFTKYIQIVAHINHYNLLISALTYITE